jgi:hypothetical protein
VIKRYDYVVEEELKPYPEGSVCKWKDVAELVRLIKEADKLLYFVSPLDYQIGYDTWRAEVKKAGIEL